MSRLANPTSALILGAAAICLAACGGGDEGSASPSLVGTWSAGLPDGCALGVTLEADNAYELDLVCELEGGGFGVEAELGIYAVDPDAITFTPTHTSCIADPPRVERMGYEVDGDTLLLAAPGGAITLDKTTVKRTGGAVVRFGCWQTDGTITFSEITPL